MENNELQKIWKTIDSEICYKSTDELNLLLMSKTKQTINKFLIIISISVFVCISVLVFLTVASLNRLNDHLYVINNVTLAIVTIISLVSGLYSWYKIQNNRYNQPLKDWLYARINLLSKWLTGRFSKLHLFIIPFIYISTVLSIHVYFENKSFIDVVTTEESIIGLIIGFPIGLFAAYIASREIRRYQLNNLQFLEDIYDRLCNVR